MFQRTVNERQECRRNEESIEGAVSKMLIIRLEKRNTSEEEGYQFIMKGRRHKKPTKVGLRTKVTKDRWVRIKHGQEAEGKHRRIILLFRL